MKTRHTIMLMAFFMATLSLCSCISDDDDNNSSKQLTEADIQACLQQIRGSYEGQMYYYNSNGDVDTLDNVSWHTQGDSLIVVENFSTKALAARITNEELRTAIENAEPQPMNIYYWVVSKNPLQWIANPVGTTYKVDYNGGPHDVTPSFYINSTGSYGDFINGEFYMQIFLYCIYLDNTQISTFSSSEAIPFAFYAKK